MKKLYIAFILFLALSCSVLAQTPEPTPQAAPKGILNLPELTSAPSLFTQALPVRVREVDGTPNISAISVMRVPNNSMSCSGSDCTFTWAVTGGTPGGSDTQVQYNNAGAFGGISGATSNGTNMTFGSGNLRATRPQFTTSIDDSNGNELWIVTATASAVNELTYANAATGNNPTWTVSGGDTNIGVNTVLKGTGIANITAGANNSSTLRINHSDGNAAIQMGIQPSTPARGAIYLGPVTISGSNYAMLGDGSSTNLNATSTVFMVINGVTVPARFVSGGTIFGGGGSVGTSGVSVLVVPNGTAPTSSPADEFQLYSADSAAGDANAFIRNEAGETNRLSGLAARNSAAFTATSTTTFATVTGLSRNVEAGRTYAFTVVAQTTANVAGGVKFQMGGSATAVAISYEGVLMDTAAIVAQTRATALATTVCALTTSTVGTCRISGVIQVNAAGTFTVDFSQNNSNGAASTVLANQSFVLTPIN